MLICLSPAGRAILTCQRAFAGKDTIPLSDASTLFTILVFIVGVLVFAYITSSIVTLVNQADISARTYQTQKLQLLGFMQETHIDKDIIKRAATWLVSPPHRCPPSLLS